MSLKDDFTNLEKKADELEKSFAMEILQDYKLVNKRQFKVILILIFTSLCLGGYVLYLLNDIGTVETTQKVSDVDTVEGNVVNGSSIWEK